LWRALMESFVCEIELGRLAAGARVPSSRTLARELGVSRTTVTQAYDELVSRGYLRARTGDGAYVAYTVARTPRVAAVGHPHEQTPVLLIGSCSQPGTDRTCRR
jgi:DNA-binding GntR family transcriptional regulator